MLNEIWKKKKVCVVDDDNDIREIYLKKFELSGYDVVGAADGEEGLRVIRAEKPDIVLLDLQMPVKGGVEVLAELHADPSIADTPVIILTNVDDEDVVKQVGTFNTKFYLIKSLTTPQKAVDYVEEVLA